MRRPIIVAVANFIFPGLGYVLLGKRVIFGVLLMFCTVVQDIQLYIDPLPYMVAYGHSTLSVTLGLLAIFTLVSAFAYDAYELAKEESN